VPPIEVSAPADAPFDASAALFRLGAVTLLHVRSAASVITVPPESLAGLRPPAVLVSVQHDGRGAYLLPDGVWQTGPGVITVTDESEPWTLTTETPTALTVLKALPSELGPGLALRRGVADGGGFGRALEPFVRGVAEGLLDGSIREGDPGLGECLLGAMRAVTHRGGPQLLARIKGHIDANLADPGLTPRAIAEAHYISVRQLHKLFEAERLTVARWIRHRRLDRCRAELADPAFAGVPVRAIAARWGLVSASHFAHAFRLAYGCSPQEYRRGRRS
jgi:AraC-like DNA-binding protein